MVAGSAVETGVAGTGTQTGTGSPLNVVVPSKAGAVYTDQSTGNVWVAETTASSSWVLAASGSGEVTSWNSRTGAVVPASADYTVGQVTGAAPLASPTFTGTPAAPTQTFGDATTALATDAFVAAAIASVNPLTSVAAATTAAGDTSSLTYSNGSSGVGATLTGANNTAITIDGITFTTLGQRLLVKNDTQSPSGARNGVYYLTQLQTTGVPPVFTRSLDYNTPANINNSGLIPVDGGTTNASTGWFLTNTVTTIGTTPLTYGQVTGFSSGGGNGNGKGGIGNGTAVGQLAEWNGNKWVATTKAFVGSTGKLEPVLVTVTQSATPTMNTNNGDIFTITGLAQAITSMTTNLSGAPVDGEKIELRITDNGTARAITWGASFASTTVTLPTTTVISTRLRVSLEWDNAGSVWACIGTA